MYNYDLIILDSYYSLNNNSRSLKEFFAFLKDLKRHDVTVLVIDHTNKNGELQGSIDKRRIADLGIQLQYGKRDNEINITYEFDRYGVSSSLTSKRFYKDFSNGTFKFVEIKEEEKEEQINRKEQQSLLEYILFSDYKIPQVELAIEYVKDKKYHKQISANCGKMNRIIKEKQNVKKYDCDLLRSKYKEFTKLGKEECLKMYQKVLTDNHQSEITLE